jgi:hypothetical protein
MSLCVLDSTTESIPGMLCQDVALDKDLGSVPEMIIMTKVSTFLVSVAAMLIGHVSEEQNMGPA